jgi:hypothetical protein
MMSVSFLYPMFLLGAVAAAVPILLHLLRRESAPEVRFSAVRFLRRDPTEQSRRQRLRELLRFCCSPLPSRDRTSAGARSRHRPSRSSRWTRH